MLLFETSRQAFGLGRPTFNYSKYPDFTFQTRQVQVFRLEYAIFLKMSKIYSQILPFKSRPSFSRRMRNISQNIEILP